MELLTFDSFVKASISKRPSKHIKSPYVADIIIDDKEYLGHTPALGCCGLSESGRDVFVSKMSGANTKCDYRINVALIKDKGVDRLVGIAPKLAEEIASNALKNGLINGLLVGKLAREKKILNSRFDFVGETVDKIPFVLEVKNVPLAKEINGNKYSYFPDGYRKKKGDTISERALKHVQELEKIKLSNNTIRCVLLFVIQRTDVDWFEIYKDDPIYLDAVREAWMSGVEIKTLQVEWDITGKCRFYSNTLPVILYDDCNLDL